MKNTKTLVILIIVSLLFSVFIIGCKSSADDQDSNGTKSRNNEENQQVIDESDALEIANKSEKVQILIEEYGGVLSTCFEDYEFFYRVIYKDDDICIYGVDISKETGEIIDEGYLD